MADLISQAEQTGKDAVNDPTGTGKMLMWVIVGSGLILGAVVLGFRVVSGRFVGTVGNLGRGLMRLGSQTLNEGSPSIDFQGAE